MSHFVRCKTLIHSLFGALLVGLMLPTALYGQADQQPVNPAQLDPSDLYFQGYLSSRSAEKLTEAGDHIGAAEKYRKAEEYFATVKKYFPKWKTDMVTRRSQLTSEALAEAKRKAEEQLQKQRDVVAELEGGQINGDNAPDIDRQPNILKVDPVANRRLKEAENEVQRLRLLLNQQRQDADRLREDQRHGADIATRQLEQMQQKSSEELTAARAEIQRLRAQAAIQKHGELENKRLTDLLKAEKIKVDRLQKEAVLLRQQRALLDMKNEDLTARQLAEAKTEIRRLKHESTMAKIQADAQIKRLKRMTGEMETEAQEKIRNYRDLAHSAEEHAQKEIARLEGLKGADRAAAEKEIKRLKDIAAKAKADADKELAAFRKNSAQEQSEAQEQIVKLRMLADKASKDAEKKQLEHDLIITRNKLTIRELSNKNEQLLKDKQRTEARLKAAEADVRRYKDRLAKAPLESEVETLNARIKGLDQERGAMALTLQQSENGYAQAMSRIAGLEKDLHQARQETVDLTRNLAAQQNAANAVVTGQRRQLEEMQKLLDAKSNELKDANQTIAQLQLELKQSKDAYLELRGERDALMMERDQMAALLQLGEEGRIKDLIDQNMGLAKKLRESKETLERMQKESHSDKDAITEALRDLAIAKSQINRLRQEKHKQEQRIEDLEQRLQDEGKALSQGSASADPQEVALLRDIIRRQLRMQTARRQARELLMNAVRNLGNQDEQLSEAVSLLETQELVLTPEEQKLIADRQVDGEFVSPFARDRKSVAQATARLKKDIDVFDRAAKKAFLAGRLHPTRELYEMILEQHPGHTPTLCKMGVVQLKLGHYGDSAESFERAAELDNESAYAHRMWGFAMMMDGRIEDAEDAARRSVDLDPNDAKNHMLLGNLCFRLGNSGDAESHFKGAINADPLSSEPYYNLALICCSDGRIKQANEFYRQALERGALPDPQLEQELSDKQSISTTGP